MAVLLLTAATALAKGGVEQITISGPGLDQPIEIDDPEILEHFNPWGGLWQFLDAPVQTNAVELQNLEGPYEVRFFQGVHEWSYSFSYYSSGGGATGYIVLPEPPESHGFVHPAGWYRSSDPWGDVMSEQLAGVVEVTSPAASWIGESLPQLLVLLFAILMLGSFFVIRRQVRERYRATSSSRLGTRTHHP